MDKIKNEKPKRRVFVLKKGSTNTYLDKLKKKNEMTRYAWAELDKQNTVNAVNYEEENIRRQIVDAIFSFRDIQKRNGKPMSYRDISKVTNISRTEIANILNGKNNCANIASHYLAVNKLLENVKL